jgi:hypothetical protein
VAGGGGSREGLGAQERSTAREGRSGWIGRGSGGRGGSGSRRGTGSGGAAGGCWTAEECKLGFITIYMKGEFVIGPLIGLDKIGSCFRSARRVGVAA